MDHPRSDPLHGTPAVDRSGRRSGRQLSPNHRCDSSYLGLLHRRIRWRTPGSSPVYPDAYVVVRDPQSIRPAGPVTEELVFQTICFSIDRRLYQYSRVHCLVRGPYIGGGFGKPRFQAGPAILFLARGPRLDATSLTAGILFYRRLTQLLATYELARNPAETQNEFAGRAHKFLTGKGSPTQPVADVPHEVVDAFYRVRFGHLELEPESLHELDARLDALESSLKSS